MAGLIRLPLSIGPSALWSLLFTRTLMENSSLASIPKQFAKLTQICHYLFKAKAHGAFATSRGAFDGFL